MAEDHPVVIAGSRSITEYEDVRDIIDAAPFPITEVVSGTAEGVDSLGEQWAHEHDIPVAPFDPEDYRDDSGPRPATLIRNEAMAEYADAAVIVWDGESNGTQHMLRMAKKHDLDIHFRRLDTTTLRDFT